jgi:hypothetical protein
MVLTVKPPPSNPPAGGSQHLCPPILPPSGEAEVGAEGELELTPHMKSLSSQHMIKWAHITSPGPEANTDAPFLMSTTLPPPQSPQQPDSRSLNELLSTPPLPTASYDVVADQTKHLELLIDSILATVIIMPQSSSSKLLLLSPLHSAPTCGKP